MYSGHGRCIGIVLNVDQDCSRPVYLQSSVYRGDDEMRAALRRSVIGSSGWKYHEQDKMRGPNNNLIVNEVALFLLILNPLHLLWSIHIN